ncbi:MAG: phosphoglycerate mutase family protein [Bacteriovoracia bacterium]
MERLILIRHAHRDTSEREKDNGLDKLGKRQAKALAGLFRTLEGKKSEPLLVSSPKKRCRETLEPIAELTDSEVEAHPLLDEQHGFEDMRTFELRIRDFFKWLDGQKKNEIVVACSHGDWLPIALEMSTGARAFTEKASYAELRRLGSRWVLYQLVQDPTEFDGS